jgi:hypothetical protein
MVFVQEMWFVLAVQKKSVETEKLEIWDNYIKDSPSKASIHNWYKNFVNKCCVCEVKVQAHCLASLCLYVSVAA